MKQPFIALVFQVIVLFSTITFLSGQTTRFTVSGYIYENGSKDTLVGANVYEPNLRIGSKSNTYGFYSITFPAYSVELTFSYVGYVSEIRKLAQISRLDVPIHQTRKIPSLVGEKDMFKVLQLLPGVQSVTEGTSGFYVRGGGPDKPFGGL